MAAGDWSIVDTGGTERILSSYYYFHVEEVDGGDYVPIEIFGTPYATQAGETADGARILSRDIFLKGRIVGTSFTVLRQRIAALYDVMKPWRAGQTDDNADNLLLRYTGSQRTVEIQCRLVQIIGGARYKDGFSQTATLQFRAQEYPYWRATSDATLTLDPEDTATTRYAIGKVSGVWNVLGPPAAVAVSGAIYCALHNGTALYVGGDFSGLDNDGDLDYFAKYTVAGGWLKVACGGEGNGKVNCIIKRADGVLVLGGDITGWGGDGDRNYCLTYNPSTDAYADMASGPGAAVRDLAIDPATGYVYAATGITVKYFDGSAWQDTTAAFTGGAVNTICFTPDGTLYAGGTIADGGDQDLFLRKRVSGSWSTVLQGDASDTITHIRPFSDGRVMLGGLFNALSGVAIDENVAIYNGQAFSDPGCDLTTAQDDVRITINSEDIAYVSAYDSGTPSAQLKKWDGGTVWYPIDISGLTSVQNIAFNGNDLYIVGLWEGTAYYSGDATSSAGGTYTNIYPTVTIKRAGGTSATLKFLENASLGLRMYFNSLYILDGETITIDCKARTVTSDFGRRITGQPLPGSDLGNFYLRGASNIINLWVQSAGSPTLTCSMVYRMNYDGFSGGDVT